jgi:hypothetical protein
VPVDKINFIKVLAIVYKKKFTKWNIKSIWCITGNWLINRLKALIYLECNEDKEKRYTKRELESNDKMLKSGQDIMDLASANLIVLDWCKFRKIGLIFDAKQAELILANYRI